MLAILFALILTLTAVPSYAFTEEPEPSPESSKGVTIKVPADRDNCLECHTQKKQVKISVLLREKPSNFISPKAYLETSHAKVACTDCHKGYTKAERRRVPARFGKIEYKTIHSEQEYRNYAQVANAACGDPKCHPGPQKDYLRGSHSQKLVKSTAELPTCTTCHNFHYIPSFLKKDKSGKKKVPAKTKIEFSVSVCGSCHRKELDEYSGNYHFKALRLGNQEAPMCDDCHGGHQASPLKAGTGDAVVACKKCHEHANTSFTKYVVHLDPVSREAPPEVLYVNLFYVVLTSLVVSMVVMHTTVLWVRRRGERRAKELAEYERQQGE